MLPKNKRLIKKKDFAAVYQKGRVYFSERRNVIIKCAKNGLKSTRIGFVVGKKYSKKAVERNRLKRLLRAAFSENEKLIQPGQDLVISYNKDKQEGKQPEYKELLQQVKEAIKKIK